MKEGRNRTDSFMLYYTWARQLEDEIGLTLERRGCSVYWKL